MSNSVQMAISLCILLVCGTALIILMNRDIPNLAVPEGRWAAGASLDGKSFQLTTVESGYEDDEPDVITFENGTFTSKNSQTYCDFGPTTYQTKPSDNVTHFTTTARCPTAPYTTVWYGTTDGNSVDVEMTWTTRRWYWTHQMGMTAQGALVPSSENAAGDAPDDNS